MPGCGKEEFLRVALESGIAVIRMGDVVREHAVKAGVGDDDKSIGTFAHGERNINHPGIWAERTLEKMEHAGDTVIDGVRSLEETEHFKNKLGDRLTVVAVLASPDIRFKRLVARGRGDAPTALREFRERDGRELGWGMGDLIARADHTLVNEGTLDEFREKTRKLLKKLSSLEHETL